MPNEQTNLKLIISMIIDIYMYVELNLDNKKIYVLCVKFEFEKQLMFVLVNEGVAYTNSACVIIT